MVPLIHPQARINHGKGYDDRTGERIDVQERLAGLGDHGQA
jgi:hypothetical protein